MEFPVHDVALDLVLESLEAKWIVADDEERTHTVDNGKWTLERVLEFYSGYDAEKAEDVDSHRMTYPSKVFSKKDLIIALIMEIKRLRMEKK